MRGSETTSTTSQRGRLDRAVRDLNRTMKRALKDRRRLFFIGVFNIALTGVAAVAGYVVAGSQVFLTALGLGAIKDGSLWAGISKQVQSYLKDKAFLAVELARIRAFCTFFEEGDTEMYDQARLTILAFYEDLKMGHEPSED